MHQLEKRLGVVLIDRSVRPPALTPAGRVFAQGARDIVDRYDDLTQKVTAAATRLEGEVTVAAIYSAGIDLLHALRQDFQARHRRCRCSSSSSGPRRSPRRASGDLQLRHRLLPPSLEGAGRERPARRAHERRLLARPPPSEPPERRSRGARRPRDDRLRGRAAGRPRDPTLLREHGVDARYRQEFDNIDSLKTLLATSDAVAILPRRTVQRELAAGTLAVVELEPELTRPLGILYRKRPSPGATALAFLDFLVRHAEPDAPRSRSPREVSVAI